MIDSGRTTRTPITPKTAQIIWVYFICAACAVIVLSRILRHQPHAASGLSVSWALAIAAAVDILVIGFVRRRVLTRSEDLAKQGDAAEAQAAWGLAQILGFAGALSIVLFGFVLHILDAPPAWISTAFFVAGLMNLAAYRPQPQQNP